ncbi:hypothetical protein D3Z38_04830 [Clostridiales bacterium]|nr:hypothetical protein [Clostridiales bacterium]
MTLIIPVKIRNKYAQKAIVHLQAITSIGSNAKSAAFIPKNDRPKVIDSNSKIKKTKFLFMVMAFK